MGIASTYDMVFVGIVNENIVAVTGYTPTLQKSEGFRVKASRVKP